MTVGSRLRTQNSCQGKPPSLCAWGTLQVEFWGGFVQPWRGYVDVPSAGHRAKPCADLRASCALCTALSPHQGSSSPQWGWEHALRFCSRPNRSLLEQPVSKQKGRRQNGRRMPACSVSFRCILSKRHLELCAYPNTYACKSKAHKHLFKAALTYRVFKLFTAAACETYQNVHIFPKILFPAPFSMIWCAS